MKSGRFLLALLIVSAAPVFAGELGGSRRSMIRQHTVAKRNEYKFLRTAAEVREWVRQERLVTLTSTANYVLSGNVSFPYARPAVKLFIDRLAAQYRAATGDRLVITSLTRPLNQQPENASALSVHPAGMAADLGVPASAKNRRWLERTLLALEDKSVLDVTRERHPKHYHVAVFPAQYERYVGKLGE
ncbi:MAG TPA: DUF5715 family protein [Gemmatimonadaceae bacterium]|jgi:hypothetical protein